MIVKSEVKKSRKNFTQNHPKLHLQRCESDKHIQLCISSHMINVQPAQYSKAEQQTVLWKKEGKLGQQLTRPGRM